MRKACGGGRLAMFAEGRGGHAVWFGMDKMTGERIGEVEIPPVHEHRTDNLHV